ncbi:MAG TPA: threonine synthase [Nitrososphaerales archaeon]|nr:threonine synthase [Nitrososphaerales archaeon]
MSAKYDLNGKSFDFQAARNSIWQFRDMMPPVSDSNIISMREGWTPFIEAKRYGHSIGSSSLWCKVEGQNPSGSFKDRAASLGLSLAMEWRKPGVFTASSGNAAAAISAYSARAGIKCLILIREDSTPSKLGQIAMYGANLLRVREIFRDQQTLARALDLTQKALPDWLNHFVWAPYNPLLIDGLKTIAYEVASDCQNIELPDCIFVPTAGGDLLYGIFKGFQELKESGAVDKIPRMVVAQGLNSSPTVAAIESGLDKVPETEKADTVAGALRVNFGTEHTLIAVRQSKGFGIAVSDDEIISAQRKIALSEGIFTEVSSATALAGIEKSIKNGRVQKDEKVVAILTGSGFKDYSPPFKDISLVPLADSSERIPTVLKSSYGF